METCFRYIPVCALKVKDHLEPPVRPVETSQKPPEFLYCERYTTMCHSPSQTDRETIMSPYKVFYVIDIVWSSFPGKGYIWSRFLIYSVRWHHWHRYAGFGYLLYSHNNASARLTLRWYLNDRPVIILVRPYHGDTEKACRKIVAAKSHI